MRGRSLFFAGAAFLLGLLVGALLFADLSSVRLPTPEGDDPTGDEPRLAPGVEMAVHNVGRQHRDVRIELRDADGQMRFQDAATLRPQETLRRDLVNLLEGDYRIHLYVDGVEEATQGFRAGSCRGFYDADFSVSEGTSGGVVVRSAAGCR